jgi:hypothetical protein
MDAGGCFSTRNVQCMRLALARNGYPGPHAGCPLPGCRKVAGPASNRSFLTKRTFTESEQYCSLLFAERSLLEQIWLTRFSLEAGPFI